MLSPGKDVLGHATMTWAQRLKRVFRIDIEVCGRCCGSVKVIACIEGLDIIDKMN